MLNSKTIGEKLNRGIAQIERIGMADFVIASSLAVVTLLLSFAWSFPGYLPSVWEDAVTSAGIRPAAAVVPGYCRLIGTVVYGIFGVSGGGFILGFLGHVSLAAIAISIYASLREVLAFIMRARPQFSKRRTIVMQLASAVGAVAFVCSDAVWSAGQCFSESLILILLTIGALEFYFVFLRKGTLKYAYGCSLLLGLLAAESPVGIFLVAVFVGIYGFILNVMPVLESPFFKPAVIAVGKWHMTFIFVAALVLGVALNCITFSAHDGLMAIGASASDVPLMYLLEYQASLTSAANLLGWVLLVAVAVAPFVVTIVRFPVAADEEQFLPYPTGFAIMVCGAIAAAQSASIPALWYWTYGTVDSPFLLSLGSFLSATTLACAVTIVGVDALCRDHARLAKQIFGADDDDGAPLVGRSHSTEIIRRVGLVLVPSAIILAIVPGRSEGVTRELLSIVGDAVTAIVDEAGDSEYIFTDGKLDPAVELESARRHGQLKCIPLFGGDDPMSVHLRLRGLGGDKEDVFSFRRDGGTGLRTWMRDKPDRLAKCSAQLGFDLWKRDGRALPEIGGFVSRPGVKTDPAKLKASVENARKIARRILDVHSRAGFKHCTDGRIREAVSSVQWRLARMCAYRADRADLAGDAEAAIADEALAKELDDCNPVYKELVSAVEKRNQTLTTRLAPREGLQLALVRADFNMARTYAEKILTADPGDADANFATGMFYLGRNQLARAEEYLKRAIVGKPREPAVYNNLAMVQLELGKLDAALVNVEKALALIPESSEVLDTKKRILDRRAGKSGGKGKDTK